MNDSLDLGSGFSLRFTSWSPDRALNPQYEGIPDQPKIGAILTCPHSDGSILFDHGPQYEQIFPNRPKWQVISWDPLTISPSIYCGNCGCHGFIIDGKWQDI